ncbi:hypothetical protein [Acidaminococcus provencensis]|uniref:hypothetical protein n=1 Tax=Acidaminococcus provencensis TaxID=2058289 RepID=UPI0022E95460|nr:hypothetical protein [Acidaminococcus provencensis]
MACFIVPMAEAVVTTALTHLAKRKEETQEEVKVVTDGQHFAAVETVPFSKKLGWLNKMLWGGSALLAFEHVWHGEVVPWFPFLTAASDPASTAEMLKEMSTVGVTMAALITLVWCGMLLVSRVLERRAPKAELVTVKE